MDLSIIIVNWNSVDYVRSCLKSIFSTTKGITFEVVVVDSGSFDGCDAMIEREFPSVIFIQSSENVGFSKANNLGMQNALGKVVLFLNPDTEVIGSALNELHRSLLRLPRAGAVGARLLNSDMSLQTSCVMSYPTVVNQILDSEFLRQKFLRSALWGVSALYRDSQQPTEVQAISGACLMVRREVYDEVGGLDERYFMYGEDVDLCFKIDAAGYGLYYVPSVEVVHHGGGSSNKAKSAFSVVMMRESILQFLLFRRGRMAAGFYRLGMFFSSMVRLVISGGLILVSGRWPSRLIPSIGKWVAILRWSIGLEKGRNLFGAPRNRQSCHGSN